jgi:hypothetical protein
MSSIALMVGLGVASVAIAAAGTGYSIYNSESQKGKGAGGGGVDKKQKKYLNQIADETYAKQNKNIAEYKKDTEAESRRYEAAGLGLSNTYETRTNKTIEDYDTGNQSLVNQSTLNANALADRSLTINEDSANQSITFNRAKQEEYIAFADALGLANAKSAQRMLFQTNPGLERLQQQQTLLADQQMNGMLSSGTQGMLSRRAAQMGGLSGTGYASDLRNNFELRDLGLTAEAQAQIGFNNASSLTKEATELTKDGRVRSDDIMTFMGLSSKDALRTNQENNLAQYTAGQNTIDIRQTGLQSILTTRSRFNEVDYTQQMGMQGNIYSGTMDALGRGATLSYNATHDWGNTKAGGILQSWANDNQAAASNATLQAAREKTMVDSAASTSAAGLEFVKDYKSGAYNSNVVTTTAPTYTTLGTAPGGGTISGTTMLTNS